MSRPLTTPQSAAAATAPSAATAGRGAVCAAARAITTVVSAMTDPTERSMPPATITTVMPIAAMQTIAVCRAISSRLAPARRTAVRPSAAKISATSTRPSNAPARSSSRSGRHARPRRRSIGRHHQIVLREIRRRLGPAETAAAHHRDAVADAEQLRQIAADQQDGLRGAAAARPRRARRSARRSAPCCRRRCRASARRAAARRRRDGAAGRCATFCWLPPDSSPTACAGPAQRIAQPARSSCAAAACWRAGDSRPAGPNGARSRHRQVVGDARGRARAPRPCGPR